VFWIKIIWTGTEATGGAEGVLVEIGPEGWTPTQQPPELSLPQLATAKGATSTWAKKEDTQT
jgi:hypothetical protein